MTAREDIVAHYGSGLSPTLELLLDVYRAEVLREAIEAVKDPQTRQRYSTVGGGLGWEAARDVLIAMAANARRAEALRKAADWMESVGPPNAGLRDRRVTDEHLPPVDVCPIHTPRPSLLPDTCPCGHHNTADCHPGGTR